MDHEALQKLLDRRDIEDTIYKYASTIDLKDYAGLRTVFTDDVVAQYAGAPEIHGPEKLVAWIAEMGTTMNFQHHMINVYEAHIDGDEARTYTYHTSHQTDRSLPDTVYVIVGRYRDVLHHIDGRWLIADKRMEVGWMEQRQHSQQVAVATEAEQNLAAQARSGVES